MQGYDIEKRNFFKQIICAVVMAFLIEFNGLTKLVFGQSVEADSEIGILFSSSTGIVLRTINPGPGERAHLDWVQRNAPAGTTLLRIKKALCGADDFNVPNLDALIPYARNNHGLTLSYGKICAVIDPNTNKVVDTVLCCPDLYQQKLVKEAVSHIVVDVPASVGDTVDQFTKTVTPIAKGKNKKPDPVPVVTP